MADCQHASCLRVKGFDSSKTMPESRLWHVHLGLWRPRALASPVIQRLPIQDATSSRDPRARMRNREQDAILTTTWNETWLSCLQELL